METLRLKAGGSCSGPLTVAIRSEAQGMTLFAATVLALPYLTLCGGPAGFTSMARYNVLSFPLFVVMALLTEQRRWAVPGIAGIFSGLLLMYAALSSQWQSIGLISRLMNADVFSKRAVTDCICFAEKLYSHFAQDFHCSQTQLV